MEFRTHSSLDRKEGKILALLHQMGASVDQAIESATRALLVNDREGAQAVVAADASLNELCEQIEEQVFTSIVRYQPVASDLRELFADAFVANELERIGDYAVGLAKMVLKEQDALPQLALDELKALSELSRNMVARALDAYVASSADEARSVAQEDEQVDAGEAALMLKSREQLKQGGEEALAHANAMVAAHIFERIADRATNIAERAVFHADGTHEALN